MRNHFEKQEFSNPKRVMENDWEKLRDMRIRAVQNSPQAFGDSIVSTNERSEEEWRRWAKDTHQFVFETNNKYIASVTLRLDDDGTWSINGVWTDPEFRELGLSTKLFQTAFKKAQELGITYIELDVNSLQTEAIALYKKLGFIEKRRIPKLLYGDGQEYECLILGIQLE